MTEMTTVPSVITGNKIIAKYLGYEYIPHNNTEDKKAGWWKIGTTREQQIIDRMGNCNLLTLGRSHNDLRFYHDWNALHNAIEVIEKGGETPYSYGTNVDISTTYCKVDYIIIDRKEEKYAHLDKRQAAWLAVVLYCQQKNDIRDKVAENQCDGCKAGYPIGSNNMHLIPYPSGSMVCQKDKYELDFKVERDGSKTYGFVLSTDDTEPKYHEHQKVIVTFEDGYKCIVELGKPSKMVDANKNFLGWSYGSHTPNVDWVAETWIDDPQ